MVVGSGPNGLAAAITLATAGRAVRVFEAGSTPGGGTRTIDVDGFRFDVCSAIHPMAQSTPFFSDYGLGIDWLRPEIDVAHVFHDGSAGTLTTTGDRWRRLFDPITRHWDRISREMLGPALKIPKHPSDFLRFGLRSIAPATTVSRVLGPVDGAVFAGIAAHANTNLSRLLSSTAGVALIGGGSVAGWPCARGGSQSIADAMVRRLQSLEVAIECDRRITSLPKARAVVLDTSAWQAHEICGNLVQSFKRFRHGRGVFKVDYALDGPMPWTNEAARRAGTVHVGGTWQEVARNEANVFHGRVPDRPFLLVAQQSLFDDTRAPAGKHTLWVYCHVPGGCSVDMTKRIETQLELFAPGFRDLVRARRITSPAAFEQYNVNYSGGDISIGGSDGLQVLFRPRMAVDPYRVGENIWLCSAATPPGGGVHGLCGLRAAESVMRAQPTGTQP